MEKYIVQKTQKIASALYLVTDLLKDSEVLKWEIREEGIALVSNALLLNTTLSGEKEQANHMLVLSADKIISFLNISLISSLISQMNASIIISEIEGLKEFVNKNINGIQLPGYILSDSFFKVDEFMSIKNSADDSSIGQSKIVDKSFKSNDKVDIKDKKNHRQESILNLLKKDSRLTIKDFSRVIRDCSEKTIQRELLILVEKGLVKKEGERRWSTYSLA